MSACLLARTVDDAAHHRHAASPRRRDTRAPDRHLVAQVGLDLVGQFLEEGAGGSAAAGARDDHRRERAQSHRLQDFLRNDAPRGCRSPPGSGSAKRGWCRRCPPAAAPPAPPSTRRSPCCPCRPRSARGAADSRSGARVRDRRRSGPARSLTLADRHDRSPAARAPRRLARFRSPTNQRLAHHLRGLPGLRARAFSSIIRASSDWSRLPQLTPIRTGLPWRHATSIICAKLSSRASAGADVARIDPVLRERLRAVGKLGQQLVAVVMEVADQRHVASHAIELLADRGTSRPPPAS
jgi:hypothetical protein